MSTVETFEHIIRHQSAHELVPFLVGLPKTDTVAVRQKVKSLKRELEAFKEHAPGSWSSLISHEQRFMLVLAGLKTYSRKEGLGPNFMIWNYALDAPYVSLFWTVLDQARPDWLGDMMAQQAASKAIGTPDYLMIREMEQRQLISHQDALFANSASELLSTLGNQLSKQLPVPENAAEIIAERLRGDALLITRDLPLVFDFDTAMDSTQAFVQLRMPADRGKWTWQTWDKAHPRQVISWLDVLVRLVDSGALSRAEVLTRSLLALRRDFRRPLLAWFKNLYLAFKPTVAERLERQTDLVELLAHPQPQVVNFSLDQLKVLWTEDGFDPSSLWVYADSLMTRQDLKTGIRTLLSGFEKLLKRDPSFAPEIAHLSASALANGDATVQEKAAKVLVAILQAAKQCISETEASAVLEVAGQYADLLAPSARVLLDPLLANADNPAVARSEESDGYQPKEYMVPELSEATAIPSVQDWHELLFLTGQVVRHEDPAVLERWVNGLLRLQGDYPANYVEQLQPYLVHMLPFVKGKTEAQAEAIVAKHSQGGHFGLVQALFLGWLQGFRAARVPQVNLKEAYYVADPLVKVEQLRLAAAEQYLMQRTGLPLLSTPTHFPYWVAPSTLVDRLLAYEAKSVAPDAADIAIALARTAFAHPAEAQAARELLPRLQHEGLRQLLAWFLEKSAFTLPVNGEKKSLVRQLTERLGKLLPSTAIVPASVTEAMPWLWAVAARTKHPNETFEQLAALTGSDYPGVVQPWKPEWVFDVKTNTYVEEWKPGKPVVTHRSTQLSFPSAYASKVPPSPLLLYSQYVRFAGMNHANVALSVDYPFVASLIPNHPAPLHWHVLRTAGWADKLESTERDVIKQALGAMLEAGPVFEEPTTRLLACGLTHHVPECRALSLEVLLSAIQNQQVLPGVLGATLGKLLAVEFVPVQRLTDNLVQARAINVVTDDALRQVLEVLLLELPDKPLRNTRKLLEAYADFVGRGGQAIPVPAQEKMLAWSQEGPLKKTILSLLSHSKPRIATATT